MGGFFVDVFIIYFLKRFVRFVRALGSNQWPTATGTVKRSVWSSGTFGCPAVQMVYVYEVEGKSFGGLTEIPFILAVSAEDYAGRFPVGTSVTIRTRPGDPSRSMLREKDQSVAHSARASQAV
jgi:hypothetical protein